MTAKALLGTIFGLFTTFVWGGSANATETFDCSINNHQWELMVHYGSHGVPADAILFISDTEKYPYGVSEAEATLDNKKHLFRLKIKDRGPEQPDLDIEVSDSGGKVIFKGKTYDIQCTWNEE